jgi:hypothetical protein
MESAEVSIKVSREKENAQWDVWYSAIKTNDILSLTGAELKYTNAQWNIT